MADDLGEPVANASDTPRRLSSTESATFAELRRIDPQLAGLFERGLRLGDEIDEPGVRYLVAHVGRELSLAIVRTLTGEIVIASEPELDESEIEDKFRGKIAAALDLPTNHPHVASWFRSHQTLVARVHWRKPPPSTGEIRDAFVELVGLLFGRIAPYFDTQAELDQLLEIDVPTSGDVERLRRCSIRNTQRRYFFSRLENPGWLRPLAEAGFFRNPPERRVHEDGSWSIQSWPEGEALARLAAATPEVAVAELLTIPRENSNPAVWNTVGMAALAVAPNDTPRLVPLLIHGLRNAPPVLFPRTILNVIQSLANAGHRDAAFQLTETLLFVTGKKRNRVDAPGPPEAGVR